MAPKYTWSITVHQGAPPIVACGNRSLYQQVSKVRDAVRFSNPGGQCGGHNMPSLVGIRLTEFQNSGWAKTNPAHPLAASL